MRVLPQELMWRKRSGRGYIDHLKQIGTEFIMGQILNLIGTSSKNNQNLAHYKFCAYLL